LPDFKVRRQQLRMAERVAAAVDSRETLAVEAGCSHGWDRYADDVIAIDHFGASAPGSVVLAEFGYTAENVVARARALLALDPPGKKA